MKIINLDFEIDKRFTIIRFCDRYDIEVFTKENEEEALKYFAEEVNIKKI